MVHKVSARKEGSRFGRASLAALLSVAVAGAFTPVAAFGVAVTATESNPYYNADTKTYNVVMESYNGTEYVTPTGGWIETDNDANTYEWLSAVHGDHSHYATYGLKIKMTVKNNVLTAIDASGVPCTINGAWGSTGGNKGDAYIGWLPEGITADATSGKSNISIKLNGWESWAKSTDLYITKMDLYKLENGTATNVGSEETSEGKSGATTKTDSSLGAAISDSDIEWTPGLTIEKSRRGESSTYAQNGTLTVKNAEANMLAVNYKIGQDNTFTVFYALGDNATEVAAYEAANKTVIGTAAESMGETNRDDYTSPAYTVILQRQLKSWLAGLSGDESELADLDTVSAATKSSVPILEALYASQGYDYSASEANSAWSQLFSSVSDDLRVTIDGLSVEDDATKVTKNASGNYVVEQSLASAAGQTGDNAPVPNHAYLYKIDKQLSTSEIKQLAKGAGTSSDAYESYKVADVELETQNAPGASGGHPEQVPVEKSYDALDCAADGTLTLKTDADYIVLTHDFDHGTVMNIAYDLAGVAAATEINTAAAAGVTESSALKLQKAYAALTTDAQGFVTADSLKAINAYQYITVKKATATVKASAVKKKAKTLSFTVSGAKTALKVDSLTKAQKKGISKVTVSGNKVKVTVKKGAKKGTYKLKVYAKAANGYKASSKQTITVKVK